MKPPGEDELGARARAGDKSAFEALVRLEKAGLYSFVRRYVGDADQAYDIVQDSFIAAWTAIRRFDPARPFGVWLRSIALNKCRDHGRRGAVRRKLMAAFGAHPREPPEPGETAMVTDARLARLDRAIAALPAIYKDPLLLTTAGGLSQQDAAKVLNTTPKAVEMRLRRARAALAEQLGSAPEG